MLSHWRGAKVMASTASSRMLDSTCSGPSGKFTTSGRHSPIVIPNICSVAQAGEM